MATPIGAVNAAPDTLNHFYGALDTVIANLFGPGEDTTQQTWIDDWFQVVSMDSAYLVGHDWLAAPVAGPEIRGVGWSDDGFDELTYQLFKFAYRTKRFVMNRDDLADSRAPVSMRARAEEGVIELKRYRERVFPELLEATTGTFLHPEVAHTAFLGTASLYSTTHTVGSQSMSNQLTLSGVGVGNIINDIWQARSAFRAMLNSNGIYYWSGAQGKPMMQFVIPRQIEQAFAAARLSEMLTPAASTSASSNYTKQDVDFTYEVLETLTSATNWYVLRKGGGRSKQRPFVTGSSSAPERFDWNFGSDFTNGTNAIGFGWRMRVPFGAGSSFHTIKASA